MKTIIFRPLRRIKKTGKVTVASYMQWRKVRTADYSKFNLIVDNEYKDMPLDEFVYDHNGEQLFFFGYNPVDIPVFTYSPLMSVTDIAAENKYYGISWEGVRVNYNAQGVDCDGVPYFSHCKADYLGTHYKNVDQFEPLTVEMVVKWFGWFLYQLENSHLQIGK